MLTLALWILVVAAGAAFAGAAGVVAARRLPLPPVRVANRSVLRRARAEHVESAGAGDRAA